MGVYIKGMEMPQEGEYIKIHANGLAVKIIYDESKLKSVPKDGLGYYAKAVPVQQHYDLIDHNALKIAVMDCNAETRIGFLKHAMDCINKAPVVIPSDMPTYEAEGGE